MRIVHLALAFTLLGFGRTTLLAQQGVGLSLEIGKASFSGHAKAAGGGTTPETTGHPSSANTWGFQLDRTGRKVRFSVGVLIASTGVVFESDEFAAEARNLLELFEISPQVAVLVLKPKYAAVRLHAGLVVDRWSPEGDQARTTMGGLGAVSLEVPLSARAGMQFRWEGSVTGSIFDEDDLPPEFERKSGVRLRWVVAGRYRL